MPGSATLYLETAALNHSLGTVAFTMPAAVYVGLCTSAPTATTPGLAVSGGAYARQSAAFAISSGGASPAVSSNAGTVQFPAATAPWGSVGWFEIWDNATTGNRLYWGPLVDPADGITPITRSIQIGDILRFQVGVLQVSAT